MMKNVILLATLTLIMGSLTGCGFYVDDATDTLKFSFSLSKDLEADNPNDSVKETETKNENIISLQESTVEETETEKETGEIVSLRESDVADANSMDNTIKGSWGGKETVFEAVDTSANIGNKYIKIPYEFKLNYSEEVMGESGYYSNGTIAFRTMEMSINDVIGADLDAEELYVFNMDDDTIKYFCEKASKRLFGEQIKYTAEKVDSGLLVEYSTVTEFKPTNTDITIAIKEERPLLMLEENRVYCVAVVELKDEFKHGNEVESMTEDRLWSYMRESLLNLKDTPTEDTQSVNESTVDETGELTGENSLGIETDLKWGKFEETLGVSLTDNSYKTTPKKVKIMGLKTAIGEDWEQVVVDGSLLVYNVAKANTSVGLYYGSVDTNLEDAYVSVMTEYFELVTRTFGKPTDYNSFEQSGVVWEEYVYDSVVVANKNMTMAVYVGYLTDGVVYMEVSTPYGTALPYNVVATVVDNTIHSASNN